MRCTSGWRTTSRLLNSTMAMPSMCLQRAVRFEQAGMLVRRQIDLRFVAGDDGLGADAEAREEHEHLLGGRVLRFVENDEGVVQRASAHVGQRRDLDDAALGVLLDFLGRQHVVQRVVQRAQIGHDLLVEIARQKAERLAGLDRRAGEDDARNLAFAQRGQRHGHGQIGLARAGRADAEGHVVAADGIEVFLLPDGLGGDAGLSCRRSGCGRS